ncbi:MAG TPA: hypothetical protein VJA85_00755 [Candidatus Limnocylindria bacterium]|nr:hypothetical protein [Candidatus Limnocylindria bacterium]
MAIDQVDRTVITQTPATPAGEPPAATEQMVRTETSHFTRSGPGGSELTRRIVVLGFGLIQILIGARIVLLLLDAREANGLVSGILNLSQVFVGPFNGMLNTNALTSGDSVLDIAAIAALAGWSVLELIVLWATGIFRREPV